MYSLTLDQKLFLFWGIVVFLNIFSLNNFEDFFRKNLLVCLFNYYLTVWFKHLQLFKHVKTSRGLLYSWSESKSKKFLFVKLFYFLTHFINEYFNADKVGWNAIVLKHDHLRFVSIVLKRVFFRRWPHLLCKFLNSRHWFNSYSWMSLSYIEEFSMRDETMLNFKDEVSKNAVCDWFYLSFLWMNYFFDLKPDVFNIKVVVLLRGRSIIIKTCRLQFLHVKINVIRLLFSFIVFLSRIQVFLNFIFDLSKHWNEVFLIVTWDRHI